MEDQANKSIFVCNHTSWAYTGLAQLGGFRTDEWLTRRFARFSKPDGTDLRGACEQIADDLSSLLRSLTLSPSAIPKDVIRRIAIVGTGFARFTRSGPNSPF